ncbi:MAG TPA: glycosyltransferase 87 family protein [Ktedonobacterales bacterium]|nr:glycosyltransferase 87 family protein [Ktedonobacterales bacterium]
MPAELDLSGPLTRRSTRLPQELHWAATWHQRGERLRAWCTRAEGRRMLLLLALALLVRLPLMAFHGFFYDLQGYAVWGEVLDHHFFDFYTACCPATLPPHAPPTYPPLTVYLYGLLYAVYALLGRTITPAPPLDLHQSVPLAIILKLPMLVADLATIALIYAVARRVRSERLALATAASYAFAPAVLFDGALWGQTDGLTLLFILLALLAALRHRGAWAGVFFALAVLLKPQPLAFAPLPLVYLYRWAGPRQAVRWLAAASATVVVVYLPYLLHPVAQIGQFLSVLHDGFRQEPYASIDGFNLWWFLGAANHDYATPYLGALSPNTLGLMLFALVVLVTLAGIWRDPSPGTLFLGAALVALAFFDVTTLQRERYLYPAVALFLLAAVYNGTLLLFSIGAGVTAFLNMAMHLIMRADPAFGGFHADPGIDLNAWASFLVHHGEYSIAVAAVNVGLLLVAVLIFPRTLPGRRASHSRGQREADATVM